MTPSGPRVGKVGQRVFGVERKHLIDFLGADTPPVLATPFLILFLEQTARLTAQEDLAEGWTTLGVEISVKHLAPTPLGCDVTCTARVVGSEDGLLSYQIEAHDGTEKIAQGFHRRRVVEVARFARRVARKMAGGQR